MSERFFYHSFPRRRGNDVVSRGLAIIESVVDRGLLLAPERVEFREELQTGSLSQPWQLFQKRICFTELTPSELADHADAFGPFAFEWDIGTLMQMGAIPVFYVPLRHTPGTLDGASNTLLARLVEVQELLIRLERLQQVVAQCTSPADLINITKNGNVVGQTRCTVAGAADVVQFLQTDVQPISSLVAAIRALCGFFYPTENPSYTEPLGYYRQREWRIIANMAKLGAPVTTAPTEDDVAALLRGDDGFLAQEMDFPSGKSIVARQCHLYRTFLGKPVVTSIRRVVVPGSAVERVGTLLARRELQLDVVALEELSNA